MAHGVRPAHEAVSDVDRPGPSDQFDTAGGKQVGLEETPVAEITVPSANGAVRHHPDTGLEIEHDEQVLDASQVTDEAQGRAQEVAGEAKAITEYAYILCNFILLKHRYREATDPKTEAQKSGLKSRFQRLKVNISSIL